MYRTEYDRDALKVLARMPADQQKMIRVKVERLAADPHGRNPQRGGVYELSPKW
jgi:mRNA-degrading endonuclease RelE of RelBE toxin-antitoxin system